jgi:hypothetical protein
VADDPSARTSFAQQHSVFARAAFKVAPTDAGAKFNAIRIPLVPVACWRLNDPAFAFDSSFVAPAFRDEITTLGGIASANPGCPAALFGHCDPAGSDDLNKTLGDRRAIAVYALITRQPDLWADLYDNPQVGDRWDLRMVQTMLGTVPDGQGNPFFAGAASGVRGADTTDAVERFQADAGLAVDGDPGPKTRHALFGAYMDSLCTPAPGAAPFRMQPGDFLGGAGAQAGDLPKMSLQSCGKFNPIVLLDAREMNAGDTTSRNADDAPNRRVMMFFFEKGTTVDPSLWPCPEVKQPNTACAAAFWPDGKTRRLNGSARRDYKDTRDTMACRFYDRFARRSPCEGASVRPVDLGILFMELSDELGVHRLAGRAYTIVGASGGKTLSGTIDDQSRLRHDDVPPDDYSLSVDGVAEKAAALVLDKSTTDPQVRFLDTGDAGSTGAS